MSTKIASRRCLALALSIAFTGTAQLVLTSCHAQDQMGQLTVTGMVKVNGKPAATGDIVSSGDAVQTAAKSSAVVSLGKLGRVEALPESKANLSFDGGSIKVALEAGRVRVSSSSGTAARVSTRDGEAVADATQDNSFRVDTTCGDTLVSVQSGRVELRAGGTVKQIAAGSQDSAGTAKPGPCRRQ
jgi:ferric-dicitrate binding protein FerR (iron transport regulator)